MNSEIAKSRIGEVIRIDTVTSTQADFLATHVPVQNIHIRKKWDSKTDKVMSEEKVFNKYVLNTENEHQFIIVIGSSGAGKSHLIRWFAARLEQSAPENEVVLFVRRSDNSLKGTIKQLLELPEVANIPNKAVYAITQYYNIIQGNLKSSQVFIRATEFNSDVRKVQKAKLAIPDEQILLNDPIPQRREIREIYEKIYTRISKVAEAEKEKANRLLEQIGMYLDYEDIDDEDIEDLIDKIKLFYEIASSSLVKGRRKNDDIRNAARIRRVQRRMGIPGRQDRSRGDTAGSVEA